MMIMMMNMTQIFGVEQVGNWKKKEKLKNIVKNKYLNKRRLVSLLTACDTCILKEMKNKDYLMIIFFNKQFKTKLKKMKNEFMILLEKNLKVYKILEKYQRK